MTIFLFFIKILTVTKNEKNNK